ncbi:MAG TPA: hypothetical protein VN929_00680 [Burkholderiales bacterium]|nr:hypothetical protein [Burkholderiales bacterium]
MQLLLNCFPIEIAPEEFSLPSSNAASWDTSTIEIQKRFQEFRTARAKNDDGSIGIFLIDGPAPPAGIGQKLVGRDHFVHVVSDVVMASLLTYFRSRGLFVESDRFGATITTPSPQQVTGEVEIRTGVGIKIKLPPPSRIASSRLLVARWEVKRDFRSNLDNPDLMQIALRKPVLYRPKERPISDDPVPLSFVGRYLGHVETIPTATQVDVSCRDGVKRRLLAKDLCLEATTATISEYEQTLGKTGTRSLWHRTQELGFVLTSSGRRNTSVLRDRLEAIRKFTSPDSSPAIVLPSPPYASLNLSLGLSPLAAEVSLHV